MDQDVADKFAEQTEKLNEIYRAIEKMRKYFLWTLIVSIAFIILPFIGLAFVIPQFLSTLTGGF